MLNKRNIKYLVTKRKTLLVILLSLLMIIRIASCIYKYSFKYKSFKNIILDIVVIDIQKIEEDKILYKVKYNNDTFLLSLKDVDNVYNYGQKLRVIASLYIIECKNNPYEYNYKRYLNSKGIVSVLYANKVKCVEERKNVFNIIYNLKNRIDGIIENNLELKKATFLKSILYGDDTLLDEEIKSKFSNIGLGHILCVSGTHVTILIFSFENITKSRKSKILRIILLIFFYIFSSFNISLLRAIIMNVLAMFKRYNNVYKRYVIALYVILLINPYHIFNIGIIFSFLSILGIILFQSQINSFLKIKLNHEILFPFFNSFSTTISSQVLIIPFEIAAFGKLTPICILSNFFLSWIITILFQLGFSTLILVFIPYISTVLFNCINLIIDVISIIVDILNSINYLDIYLPRFNLNMYISYYLLIIVILVEDKIWIYFWEKRKTLKKILSNLKITCVLNIIIQIIYIQYFQSYVIYFNVGQGNMALVHSYTKNIIIDMGSTEKNVAYNVMKNYLKSKNIRNIDLVLITHMHTDHMNGVEALIKDKDIKVFRLGFSKPCMEVAEFNDLLNTMEENKVSKVYLNEEDVIQSGNLTIEILAPPRKERIQDLDMLNANSTIYLVEKSRKKYLFMGDATKKTEKYILDNYQDKLKNIEVYQVSHHGSSTSSYEPFISKLNRAICIISAKKSVYGHPSDSVLSILKKYNLIIKITEKDGAIIF